MKKYIFVICTICTMAVNAQYCAFFDFKATEPEMVVSTLKGMMDTGWGKNIQGTKSLFSYQFNGPNQATHSIQFCFPDEVAFANFFTSWSLSTEAQLFGEKLGKFTEGINQALNTPLWYKNDWSNDQAFMIYQLDISDTQAYLNIFKEFTQTMAKKLGYENNSYGIGYPIIGKVKDFTHFVWMGANDVESSLRQTKQMLSDDLFASFSKDAAGIRKVVTTIMMVRVMDF